MKLTIDGTTQDIELSEEASLALTLSPEDLFTVTLALMSELRKRALEKESKSDELEAASL